MEYDIPSNNENRYDVNIFFAEQRGRIESILRKELRTRRGIRVFFSLPAQFSRLIRSGDARAQKKTINYTFHTDVSPIHNEPDIQYVVDNSIAIFNSQIDEFLRDGSGWLFDFISSLGINIVTFNPLAGSSYIETPEFLFRKKAIINIKNEDKKCFLWSVLAHIHPQRNNPDRVSHYKPFANEMVTTGLRYPVSVDQIPMFEKQNNLSINVLGYADEGKEIFPLFLTTHPSPTDITLLLLTSDHGNHYCLVRGDKGLSRLLGHRTKHSHRAFVCHFCLHPFSSEKIRENHLPYCAPNGPQNVEMVKEADKILRFKHISYGLPSPFVIYCDFESILRKHESDSTSSSTVKYQKHEASSFAYIVVCTDKRYSSKPFLYRGPNAVEKFLERMNIEEKKIHSILSKPVPMEMSSEDQRNFLLAMKCHICDQPLNGDRCRDHDHFNGKYRGAAHSACNLNFRFEADYKNGRFSIPVIFHNFRGYDSHHLITSGLGAQNEKLECIARNPESFLTIQRNSLEFIDSIQFLNESLSTLVENLRKGGTDCFEQLREHFPTDKIDLLTRKGVFPYSYLDSFERFDERELPPKSEFFNDLSGEDISDEDYDHAQKVWITFNMKTFGDYHDLYLQTDTILLCDVFENFRDLCQDYYKLDPCHYVSAPGVSWDAMLKMTGVELELITDPTMYCFLERGVRGGVSVISHRYARANNKYVQDFNPEEPSSFIIDLDANNLYGWAMSESLACKDFRWLTEEEISNLHIRSIADDANTGYILEVDLRYPNHLHEEHNDYPLASESLTVTESMLSNYCKSLFSSTNEKPHRGTPKLIPNLNNKTNYIVHYRNLKFYLDQGLVLRKIHKVLSFSQSCWLKPYIDFNTQKRKEAKNEFEKNFFKQLNNSVFGKSLESVRNRQNVHLVNNEKKLLRLCRQPHLKSFKILSPSLCVVHMKMIKVTLNRPIYLGFSILDVSKLLMFDFHYNFIRARYGLRSKLLFIDTDSMTYHIETDDLYADLNSAAEKFDFSAYPRSHFCFSDENKKVLGKMKDENNGVAQLEFVGLKSKMYSITEGKHEK